MRREPAGEVGVGRVSWMRLRSVGLPAAARVCGLGDADGLVLSRPSRPDYVGKILLQKEQIADGVYGFSRGNPPPHYPTTIHYRGIAGDRTMKKTLSLSVFFACALVSSSVLGQSLTPAEVAKEVFPSTLLIVCYDSGGQQISLRSVFVVLIFH